MLNIHRHWHLPSEGSVPSLPDGDRAVIQLTPEQAKLAEDLPGQMFSVGLHPWDIPADSDATQRQMAAVAQTARLPNVRLIGESGLDSLRKDRMPEAAYDRQETVLAQHADIAEKVRKPLLLHVVRRYGEVLQMYRMRRPTVPWIVHGFGRGPELMRQLTEAGLYVSFGAALLDRPQTAEAWAEADIRRVFLETDDREVDISDIYDAAARIRHTTVAELQRLIDLNFAGLYDM
ncbi:MAG: TatD family hydrolase [Bacteroidales bacterium]|nr:TatD family hydrolase [Bacteroidales bacterium]